MIGDFEPKWLKPKWFGPKLFEQKLAGAATVASVAFGRPSHEALRLHRLDVKAAPVHLPSRLDPEAVNFFTKMSVNRGGGEFRSPEK